MVFYRDPIARRGRRHREGPADAAAGGNGRIPQVLKNVPVGRGAQLDSAKNLWEAVRQAESELGDRGRILIRPSGTEPLVRVMVEASSESLASGYADRLAALVTSELGGTLRGGLSTV